MSSPDVPDFHALEHTIAAHWKNEKIFEQSVALHEPEHVFYDGPPFPTGSPHYGTIFVSVIKDSIARYFTMKGKSVPRVWGWDCHGLPIETAVEKSLGITNKKEIQEIGVEKFNAECRRVVMDYHDSWREYIEKIGRWVDYEHPYRTLDRDYMESVIWVFKECWAKGLIYRDYRVTPYCYRCETSLSISDTREPGATRPRKDLSMVVRLRLTPESAKIVDPIISKPIYFLAWTTTPWTLPANVALGVGKKMEYSYVDTEAGIYILATDTWEKWRGKIGLTGTVMTKVLGDSLVGLRYNPSFHADTDGNASYRVVSADFVTTDEGVGIVHLAPAYGEDDYWLGRAENLGFINYVDEQGVVTEKGGRYAGLHVHHDAQEMIGRLTETGDVLHTELYEHSYPHCWRCDTPLIYRAMDAWYLAVESIKDKLIEKNQEINWIPDAVKNGRFGNWLEGARDWNISRNRYWGTPLPVWECSNGSCVNTWVAGSAADLEEKAGHPLPDLHIEFIDTIEFECKCGGIMRRVPEVLDGWFESGAMPFAQCHYPFENREWFIEHFPADFIAEYPGQIRAWFYYLHVLAVALLDKPPFKNCLVHGTLLNKDGQKFSKSKKNYIDPLIVIDRYGADAMRIYLLGSSAAVLSDLRFREEEILDEVKRIILPFWNACNFYTTYAEIDGFHGDPNSYPTSEEPMDRWICLVTGQTARIVGEAFSAYTINRAVGPIVNLIENLTNWYIRRTRERFWSEKFCQSKQSALETLFYVLCTLSKMLAPIAPFISDHIFRSLTGRASVHLEMWPATSDMQDDSGMIDAMETVRTIVALGLSLRQKSGVRTRQPLRQLRVILPATVSPKEVNVNEIASELNVKSVEFVEDFAAFARIRAVPDARKLGPRHGKDMQKIINAAREGFVRVEADAVTVYDSAQEWTVNADEIAIGYEGIAGYDVANDRGIVVALETILDENLVIEGIANDLNREIQSLRKLAGYHVTDRIYLDVSGPLPDEYKRKLAEAALAELKVVPTPDIEKKIKKGGMEFSISLVLRNRRPVSSLPPNAVRTV